jgi:hypothetical protein
MTQKSQNGWTAARDRKRWPSNPSERSRKKPISAAEVHFRLPKTMLPIPKPPLAVASSYPEALTTMGCNHAQKYQLPSLNVGLDAPSRERVFIEV